MSDATQWVKDEVIRRINRENRQRRESVEKALGRICTCDQQLQPHRAIKGVCKR